MFEKEAEEYRESITQRLFNEDDVESAWQKGAEFGYNKANEWHKVLDGDFPKHNNEVLCLFWGGIKEVGYYKNELWYFEDFTADKDDVDYWQEIVLPEVKENMAKKDQIKGFEETINNIPLVIDPCKMCKIYKKHNGWFMGEFKKGE